MGNCVQKKQNKYQAPTQKLQMEQAQTLPFATQVLKLYCPKAGHDNQLIIAVCFFPSCKIPQKGLCFDCVEAHQDHKDSVIKVPEIDRFIKEQPIINTTGIKEFQVFKASLLKQLKLIEEFLESDNLGTIDQLVFEDSFSMESLDKLSQILGNNISINNQKIFPKQGEASNSNGKNYSNEQYEKVNNAIERLIAGLQDKSQMNEGTYEWITGDKYTGEYDSKSRSGKGVFTLVNGTKYTGEWKNGQYNGKGQMEWANAEKYVGDFVNGMREGQGDMIYDDGRKFQGQWKNDKRNGNGVNLHSNGAKFVGNFVDDKAEGHCEYTYSDGAKYVGNFMNGQKNGQGEYYYPDGRVYKGQFKDGQPNGKGTEYNKNGQIIYQGEWINGNPQKN